MIRLCSVEGCGKPAWSRGWCGTHYSRWRRHGDVIADEPVREVYTGPCMVDGCERPVRARGFCNMHWQRWSMHGDPTKGGTPKGERLRFLLEEAIPYRSDECLIWPFSRNMNGYATMKIDGTVVTVSRWLCEEVNGPPPTPDMDSAHSCGKGHEGCVAPNHLRWATRTENMADCLLHGTLVRGEDKPNAKLTEADVRKIRSLRGRMKQRDIARMFGVTRVTIGQVQRRQRWGWLD